MTLHIGNTWKGLNRVVWIGRGLSWDGMSWGVWVRGLGVWVGKVWDRRVWVGGYELGGPEQWVGGVWNVQESELSRDLNQEGSELGVLI